jgi:hypothetical protein
MNDSPGFLSRYFGVVTKEQTYLNLIYLLLAFPLSVAYFVFLVTGLSLGFGTLIIWVGIPILLALFAASWGLAMFERTLAMLLLREDIPPMAREEDASKEDASKEDVSQSAWERVKAHLGNRVTWTSLIYLILKFPVATTFFVFTVTVLSLAVGLLITPLIYRFWDYPSGYTFWKVDTLGEALILAALSLLFVGPIALHIVNFLARLSGAFARVSLGKTRVKAGEAGEAKPAIQS